MKLPGEVKVGGHRDKKEVEEIVGDRGGECEKLVPSLRDLRDLAWLLRRFRVGLSHAVPLALGVMLRQWFALRHWGGAPLFPHAVSRTHLRLNAYPITALRRRLLFAVF